MAQLPDTDDTDDTKRSKVYKRCVSHLKTFVLHWSNYNYDWKNNNRVLSLDCHEYMDILLYWFSVLPLKYNKNVTFGDINNVWVKKWFAKNDIQIATDLYIKENFMQWINEESVNIKLLIENDSKESKESKESSNNDKTNDKSILKHRWINNIPKNNINNNKSDAFGLLALIILFDQMTRNCFRNNKKCYNFDEIGLKLCLTGIDNKLDIKLPIYFRFQYYLPLVHCENIEIQNMSIEYYLKLKSIVDSNVKLNYLEEFANRFVKIAKLHHYHILTFGRFPERNKLLNRKSTQKELVFFSEIYLLFHI